MYLVKINILNYRNISECSLEFSPKMNLFLGKNGMGKTNILDTIHYLSFCKSHLNSIDSHLIKRGNDFFILQGEYSDENKIVNVSCSVKQRRKKKFLFNKKTYDKLSDHIGKIPLILVSPSDLSLIYDGSDQRRRFMDMIISQYNRNYLESLMRYNYALYSRNALMKKPQNIDNTVLDLMENKMSVEAKYIFQSRKDFMESFMPVFREFYQKISSESEMVDMEYISDLQKDNFAQQLFESREKDKCLGFSTVGIHRDDISMMLNGFHIKKTGSQGQKKTYLVAMKLAQFMFLKEHSSTTPILLLDDLFDKLDSDRVNKIIKEISQDSFGQIFISDTNREHIDTIIEDTNIDFYLFEVENGAAINIKK